MGAADNYEQANLEEQRRLRREARQTITLTAAIAMGTAAVIVAVLAALATANLMDAIAITRSGKCI